MCLDFITAQDGDIFFLIYLLYFYRPLKLNGTSEACWKASLAYDFTLIDHSSSVVDTFEKIVYMS